MAYSQKFGKQKSEPIKMLSDKLKEGSGLLKLTDQDGDGDVTKKDHLMKIGVLDKSGKYNSAATMYGAPVHMKSGKSKIGHISGINYGSPVKHESGPEGHIHDEKNPDRYSYQSTNVEAGTKRTRKARRKLARSLTEAANQGVDVQGYTTSGTKGKLRVKNKRLTIKTKGKGGAEGAAVGDQTSLNTGTKVKKRDVRKQLKETGTVTIKGGKVGSGTTQTVTKKGSAKMDAKRAAAVTKRQETKKALAAKKANAQANREAKQQSTKKEIGSRRAEINSKREAAKKKQAEGRKAYLEKRKKERTKTKK